ncbi:hypothetical protein M0D21_15250 [Aquimarina sp. D1M17]|uniref:hypothetical protein n=1 Tax=Aquimarina acroporae TaxID=2937283 RepID=UPI0020C17F39|nr:hypothetical protein [Aquimarina acroporae]MCK8522933.1 hypothetical protein [Aquimarina acroporae]
MSNDFDALQRQWQKDKEQVENNLESKDEMLATITSKGNWSQRFHYGNIIVLILVLVGIGSFFYFVAPVQKTLSHIGIGLMTGGLALRICIEFISISKLKKINSYDTVLKSTSSALSFYQFRKKIHGPITISIIVLYTIGFFLITFEFALYFSSTSMVLIYISYVIGAIIPIVLVRKNIIKEIKILHDIVLLKNKIIEEPST